MSTTSGSTPSKISSASRPDDASPTTSRSPASSSDRRLAEAGVVVDDHDANASGSRAGLAVGARTGKEHSFHAQKCRLATLRAGIRLPVGSWKVHAQTSLVPQG
jgi:hypothetical protein